MRGLRGPWQAAVASGVDIERVEAAFELEDVVDDWIFPSAAAPLPGKEGSKSSRLRTLWAPVYVYISAVDHFDSVWTAHLPSQEWRRISGLES